MQLQVKLRVKRLHEYTGSDMDEVEVTVFLGQPDQTLQNTGKLRMRLWEYQRFYAALRNGQETLVGHMPEVLVENV